MQITLEYWC